MSVLINGGGNVVLGTSYTAEDEDLKGVETDYTKLEDKLRKQIDRIETDHPGCDGGFGDKGMPCGLEYHLTGITTAGGFKLCARYCRYNGKATSLCRAARISSSAIAAVDCFGAGSARAPVFDRWRRQCRCWTPTRQKMSVGAKLEASQIDWLIASYDNVAQSAEIRTQSYVHLLTMVKTTRRLQVRALAQRCTV